MIEDYMKLINQQDFLDQCKGEKMKDSGSRHKIVQIAVDFMIDHFGENISMFQRQIVAQALIKLFPFLGFKDGENIGIVSWLELYIFGRLVNLINFFSAHLLMVQMVVG